MFKPGKKTSSKTISYYTSRVPGVYGQNHPKSSPNLAVMDVHHPNIKMLP